MVVILDKVTRELIGVAENFAEATALRKGRETVVEIVGNWTPRIGRK